MVLKLGHISPPWAGWLRRPHWPLHILGCRNGLSTPCHAHEQRRTPRPRERPLAQAIPPPVCLLRMVTSVSRGAEPPGHRKEVRKAWPGQQGVGMEQRASGPRLATDSLHGVTNGPPLPPPALAPLPPDPMQGCEALDILGRVLHQSGRPSWRRGHVLGLDVRVGAGEAGERHPGGGHSRAEGWWEAGTQEGMLFSGAVWSGLWTDIRLGMGVCWPVLGLGRAGACGGRRCPGHARICGARLRRSSWPGRVSGCGQLLTAGAPGRACTSHPAARLPAPDSPAPPEPGRASASDTPHARRG